MPTIIPNTISGVPVPITCIARHIPIPKISDAITPKVYAKI